MENVRTDVQRGLFGEEESELNLVFSMLSTSVTRPSWTVICTEPKRRFWILLNTTSIHSLLDAEFSFCLELVVGVDMALTGYFSGVERAICDKLARNPSAGSALRLWLTGASFSAISEAKGCGKPSRRSLRSVTSTTLAMV